MVSSVTRRVGDWKREARAESRGLVIGCIAMTIVGTINVWLYPDKWLAWTWIAVAAALAFAAWRSARRSRGRG
jgi:hypothetical protein